MTYPITRFVVLQDRTYNFKKSFYNSSGRQLWGTFIYVFLKANMIKYWRGNHGTNFFDRYWNKESPSLRECFNSFRKRTKKTFDINGKNGSGKTSLLEALVKYFLYITSEGYYSIENVNSHYEKYNGQLRPFIHQSHFHRISQVIDNNIFFLLWQCPDSMTRLFSQLFL